MAKKYEGAKFSKVCKELSIWNLIKPNLEKVKLGGTVRIPVDDKTTNVFHLVAIDHSPREKGLDYDWYYLMYCRTEKIEEKRKWEFTRLKRCLLNVIKLLKESKE